MERKKTKNERGVNTQSREILSNIFAAVHLVYTPLNPSSRSSSQVPHTPHSHTPSGTHSIPTPNPSSSPRGNRSSLQAPSMSRQPTTMMTPANTGLEGILQLLPRLTLRAGATLPLPLLILLNIHPSQQPCPPKAPMRYAQGERRQLRLRPRRRCRWCQCCCWIGPSEYWVTRNRCLRLSNDLREAASGSGSR